MALHSETRTVSDVDKHLQTDNGRSERPDSWTELVGSVLWQYQADESIDRPKEGDSEPSSGLGFPLWTADIYHGNASRYGESGRDPVPGCSSLCTSQQPAPDYELRPYDAMAGTDPEGVSIPTDCSRDRWELLHV